MRRNRKRVSKEQKFIILKEHFDKGTSISELARINNIHPITLYHWKRQMADQPEEKINIQEILSELQKLKKDNERLTKALGNAHLDIECSKEIIEILKKKSQEHLLKQPKKFSKK